MVTARAAAIAAMILTASCSLSKPITNEEAGAIIRESTAFKRPKLVRLPRQITFQRGYYSSYGADKPLSISQLAYVDPVVAILKLQRMISVEESIFGAGGGVPHLFLITPNGIEPNALLPDVEDDARDPQAIEDRRVERYVTRGTYLMSQIKRDRGWRLALGEREFVEVDQIHNWKDANIQLPVNELAIDFSWRWQPNELGDAFDARSTTFESMPDSVQEAARSFGVRMNTSERMHSRAFLRRGSDGKWTLRVIEWSFGRGNPD